jgi:hypothetical protein
VKNGLKFVDFRSKTCKIRAKSSLIRLVPEPAQSYNLRVSCSIVPIFFALNQQLNLVLFHVKQKANKLRRRPKSEKSRFHRLSLSTSRAPFCARIGRAPRLEDFNPRANVFSLGASGRRA